LQRIDVAASLAAGRMAALWLGRQLTLSATSGHPSDQKIATPMTGFKVQPP
jgi:hypothetical protein